MQILPGQLPEVMKALKKRRQHLRAGLRKDSENAEILQSLVVVEALLLDITTLYGHCQYEN